MTDHRRTKLTTAPLGPASALTRVDTSTCRLVVLNTVSKGTAIVLDDDRGFLVGASDGCDLQIEDPTVSAQHAEFYKTAGGARVIDKGSTNGTFYERSRVSEVVVPFGATVSVGKAQIKIVPNEAEVRAEPSSAGRFGDLVGEDRRMRQMFSLLEDVAPTEATVVIEGETGTGKELVARALHDYSSRARNAFVVFDCSAVPHDLVESALFGHIKGSFTGATQSRQGAFKQANGGTIFLDEIGELPLDLQPKLLRAIESRTVQMVGADKYERVDVRVVAATNRNLKQEVRAGRFREDLYYRLAVVRILMPALRERISDVPVLVNHFIASDPRFAGVDVDPNSYGALMESAWPGNVRELKNLVERACSLSRGDAPIDLSAFLVKGNELQSLRDQDGTEPHGVDAARFGELLDAIERALDPGFTLSFREAKAQVVEAFERRYLGDLMRAVDGNISKAAQKASMDRKHLRELLKKNGLWGESS